MTYNDLLAANNILSGIPLTKGDKSLPTKAATEVILLQVAYQQKVTDFDKFMLSVLQKLKKEGFEERNQKYAAMKNVFERLSKYDVNSDMRPTEEEVNEARDTQATAADFEKELSELETAYQHAYSEKLKDDAGALSKMSTATYEALVDFIGLSGEMELEVGRSQPEKIKVQNQDFLKYICFHLVLGNE